MELVQCPKCLGRKGLTGLGMMQIDCDRCKAAGYVEKENVDQFLQEDADVEKTIIANMMSPVLIHTDNDNITRRRERLKNKGK